MSRRRRPLTIRDFLSADEIDHRAFDRRSEWTIREHSRLKRQWRFVRRLPGIVQVIIVLFVLAFAVIVGSVAWLVTGALTML